MAVVATELAQNQLVHARQGTFTTHKVERAGVVGVEIVAADRGAGIASPTRALEEHGSTAGGLGSGLAGARRLSDEIDFDVRHGEGTCIRARKWQRPVPWRSEVAIIGRPLANEDVSGDDAAFFRLGETLTLGVADGLGHGPEAREASARAIAVLKESSSSRLEDILRECDAPLFETRGTVMAVARIDPKAQLVEHACVGNVQARLYRPRETQRFASHPGVLGAPKQGRRFRTETFPLQTNDVLVMFSDGLSTKVDISEELLLLWQHPIVIAEHILNRFGQSHDDAIVLVAR